jgi:hypothetical protein
MSTDPEAKLFYGYLQPDDDKEKFNEEIADDADYETSWSGIHTKHAHGCIGEIYGYSSSLGFFLAVEKSLHEVMWDKVKMLSPQDLTIQPEWDDQLRQAAQIFNLDISQLQPGWHLVCLYF